MSVDKREAERGYQGTYPHYYQALQERRWWGWTTLDHEEVPSHVLIARGALGFDDSGWRSKFAYLGTWGRDGMVCPAS